MGTPTLAEKIARRDRYVTAETAILGGAQSYSVDGLTITRVNISWVQNLIKELNREISADEAKLAGNGGSFNKVTFGRPI